MNARIYEDMDKEYSESDEIFVDSTALAEADSGRLLYLATYLQHA